jgi:type IV pilus assembly protein PilX
MNRIGTNKHRQSGAALVIGLLLLLVLTLLAVSSMNTASTELAMAGNAQYQQNAFQAAETGIERALVDGGFNPGAGVETEAGVAIAGSTTDTYTTIITPQLSGTAQPAMWGSSWDSFSTFHFEINSTGASTRNAMARNLQGVAVIAPKDPTVAPIDPTTTTLTP